MAKIKKNQSDTRSYTAYINYNGMDLAIRGEITVYGPDDSDNESSVWCIIDTIDLLDENDMVIRDVSNELNAKEVGLCRRALIEQNC
jgi:hypothetical protein